MYPSGLLIEEQFTDEFKWNRGKKNENRFS